MMDLNITISVVACTHNPRREYLARTLDALMGQTLSMDCWELLVVDNASTVPVASEHSVQWHPNGRCVVETELGLTCARLRGIRETTGDIIVFVDDDNVLNSNYLELAVSVGKQHPNLGAWGGQIIPEFEVPVEDWMRPYFSCLALRELTADRWSNWSWESQAFGAGLCLRRAVALEYQRKVNENPLRRSLDRTGTSLVSSGDLDLVQTSYDLSMGTGLFKSLSLTHIIPAVRLTPKYLSQLAENISYSNTLLNYLQNGNAAKPVGSWKRQTFNAIVDFMIRKMSNPGTRRYSEDLLRGQKRGMKEIEKWKSANGSGSRPQSITH